jgi:hypothetical protein
MSYLLSIAYFLISNIRTIFFVSWASVSCDLFYVKLELMMACLVCGVNIDARKALRV